MCDNGRNGDMCTALLVNGGNLEIDYTLSLWPGSMVE